MTQVRVADHVQMGHGLTFGAGSGEEPRAPEFAIAWIGWREQFTSSVLVLLRGPVPPKQFRGAPFFRDCWIEQPFPKFAFAAAVALQVLLVLFPPPIWNIHPSRPETPSTHMELTWYGPVKDFPALLPAARAPKAKLQNKAAKVRSRRGADAFHPRQTIISEPLHPTHPRQTLIQPAAPPEPPKILPQLPNIVRLAQSEPARPKLQLTPEQLAAMRPKAPASRAPQDAAIPDVATPEKQMGAINITSSTQSPPKPAVPVSPMSAPRAAQQKDDTNTAAPEIAQQVTGDSVTLIALSATPAPVAPPPAVPAGNLSARISISPEGSHPGRPGDATEVKDTHGGTGGGGGGRGPEGIFISGGNKANTASTSGLGIGAASRGVGNPLPSRPVPRVNSSLSDSKATPSDSGSTHANSKVGVPAEDVLGPKHVYTLQVNMPNLTSASGSWVLNFAELDEMDAGPFSKSATSDLSGPVPLRKVDPKYPPELRAAHVEGEVVLYAVIRKDGTVDSIQLVHGVDPHLDVNAMDALAQWKFRPAEKHGAPIDLEAVVHIPFRSRAPEY
jgi:TonB family protein